MRGILFLFLLSRCKLRPDGGLFLAMVGLSILVGLFLRLSLCFHCRSDIRKGNLFSGLCSGFQFSHVLDLLLSEKQPSESTNLTLFPCTLKTRGTA